MKRRTFIAGLGSVAALPVAARAQQRAMPVIGLVNLGSADGSTGNVAAFRKGLGEKGYVEGQNVTVELHSLDGQFDGLPALMADVVRPSCGRDRHARKHRRGACGQSSDLDDSHRVRRR